MKKLRWLGSEKVLPGIAHVNSGQEFYCGDKAAESYISQGQAELVVNSIAASDDPIVLKEDE